MTRELSHSTIVDDHGQLITWALRYLNVPLELREDARQGGAVGLLVALDRYKPERGRYRSFAASHVLGEVRLATGRDRRQPVQLVPLDNAPDERLACDDADLDRVHQHDAIAAAGTFLATLGETDRYILRRLHEDGATQTAIAAELGTNKKAISRRVAQIYDLARAALADHALVA